MDVKTGNVDELLGQRLNAFSDIKTFRLRLRCSECDRAGEETPNGTH